MTRSKTADIIFNKAQKLFGEDLVNIGIGGSFELKEDRASDLDIILITYKSDLSLTKVFVDELQSELGKKVSVSPLTRIQLLHGFWGDKVMTMVWKGCRWMTEDPRLNIPDSILAEQTSKLLPESLQRIKKAVLSGKITESRAIDLFEQYILILWKQNQ